MSLRLNSNELKEIRPVMGQCLCATAESEIFASQKRAFLELISELTEIESNRLQSSPKTHPEIKVSILALSLAFGT